MIFTSWSLFPVIHYFLFGTTSKFLSQPAIGLLICVISYTTIKYLQAQFKICFCPIIIWYFVTVHTCCFAAQESDSVVNILFLQNQNLKWVCGLYKTNFSFTICWIFPESIGWDFVSNVVIRFIDGMIPFWPYNFNLL